MTATITADERESMLQVISDLSKDAFGFRVRRDYDAMSDTDLVSTWDFFIAESKRRDEEDHAIETRAAERLRTQLAALQHDHKISREDALRWLMDAEGARPQEWGYFLYCQGLGCGEIARQFSADVGRTCSYND